MTALVEGWVLLSHPGLEPAGQIGISLGVRNQMSETHFSPVRPGWPGLNGSRMDPPAELQRMLLVLASPE
jgi:hypothetical protein